jgi:DNA-binding NarL/FixJ family response regulator
MDEVLYAERALRAGARGYVMKEEVPEVIREAIDTVLGGELYVSRRMAVRLLHQVLEAKPLLHEAAGVDALSDRELQIYQMIGAGLGTQQIARELRLSPKTVETHRENIKHKLNLPDAATLLLQATTWVQDSGSHRQAKVHSAASLTSIRSRP